MTAMQTAKKKKHDEKRMGTLPFVGLWIVGYIIGWVVLVGLYEADVIDNGTTGEHLLFGIISGVPMLLAQTWLMRTQLNLRIKHWFSASLFTWVIAVTVMFNAQDMIYNLRYRLDMGEQALVSLQIAIMFMPTALLQTALLWKHVRNAWLWTLAGGISAVLFAMPIVDSRSDEQIVAVGLAALLQGMTLALMMRFLSKQRRTGKDKNGF